MRKIVFVVAGFLAHSASVYALSPEAEAGAQTFPRCNACHNAEHSPPLAPPFWAIQKRYKKIASSKAEFIERVALFARQPTKEKAYFQGAVQRMGLMPAFDMPGQELRDVAAYIYEQPFAPPCTHWKHGAEMAEKAGDADHAAKDRAMLRKFCD